MNPDEPAAAPAPDEPREGRGYMKISKMLVDGRRNEFNEFMAARAEASGAKSMMGPLGRTMLYALVCRHKPRIIVESGGNLGMASSFILKAMQDSGITDGKLYSIERSKKFVPGSIIPEEIKGPYVPLQGDVADLLQGDALPAKIDMFLHDSTHRYNHMMMEFEAFWPRLRSGGLLVSHDVNMNAAFVDFVSKTYVHDDGGIALPEKTGHFHWGYFAELGYVVKA